MRNGVCHGWDYSRVGEAVVGDSYVRPVERSCGVLSNIPMKILVVRNKWNNRKIYKWHDTSVRAGIYSACREACREASIEMVGCVS